MGDIMAKGRIYTGHYTESVNHFKDDGSTDESGNPRDRSKEHIREIEDAAGLSAPLPNGRRGR